MAKVAEKTKKKSIFQRMSTYFSDVIAEFKRVVWPSRPEVVNSSVVVIITLIFFIAFTFVIDQAATTIVSFLAGLGG